MIIQCVNCYKKFEVEDSLIPDEGRNLTCGSCNHNWFYIPINNQQNNNIQTKNINSEHEDINVINDKKDKKIEKIDPVTKKSENINPKKKKSSLSLGKILSYIIVSIISFIALIIVLDTFKSPLQEIFPGLELLLYNLFESIKDMILFLKNLLT
tara:strand:+ start:297 stop:758 length:462 start_codon:yes stop_codon:yes gene_type:complete